MMEKIDKSVVDKLLHVYHISYLLLFILKQWNTSD